MLKKLLITFCGAVLLTTATMVSAGPCTDQDKAQMRQGGMPEWKIKLFCPDTSFPIWDKDGNMIVNSDGQYIGKEFPECKYVKYSELENCKTRATRERQQVAQFPNVDKKTGERFDSDGFDAQGTYHRHYIYPTDCGGGWGTVEVYRPDAYGQSRPVIEQMKAQERVQILEDCRRRDAECAYKWNHCLGSCSRWDAQNCNCIIDDACRKRQERNDMR